MPDASMESDKQPYEVPSITELGDLTTVTHGQLTGGVEIGAISPPG